MRQFTPAEVHSFLLEKPRPAKLATVRADGRPHVAPIWFDLDGEALMFTTGGASVKAANLRRDARVCLCVDDDTPPFAFVLVEGTVTLSDDLEALRYWATRIGGRYMGNDLAEAYGKRNGVPDELLARVTPTKMIGRAGISD